mmetsp:Transcript_29070/g.64308  ORF Transcript_29070/g.64308 Transcript_29070/m.64308 type:complete len:691 (+) Transcript_29070:2-2074(+)
MEDPVTAADGITYERTAIEAWMARQGAVGIYRTPLTSRELHTNRALKVAIEFHTQQAGEVASLQNDARDLKECLRALEGDLKHAASKNANKVDHVDYLRVCSENKFLQSKVSRLEAELATMKSSSRAAASRIHEDRLGHEEKTALTGQLSPILGESGSQDLDLPQSGLPALHNIISSTISKDRAEAESVKQSHEAQATRCQAELDDANRRAREMGDHAQKEEEEIMGAEAAVKQGRESLSSLHEQLQEQLRERDSVGEKYADEWNRLRGTCAGLDPKADLQAVQDSPYEERGGLLEEYAACHRKVLELQQKHLHVKENICEHEKCLQRRREEAQALWDQLNAEQELASNFEQEKRKEEEFSLAFVSKVNETTTQEATFQDHARHLCSTYGPFAQSHATEANLLNCALLDALLEKRLKAFERVMLQALPEESLGRLLASGGITVKAALEDFGEEVVMTCVKELCKTPGPQGARAREVGMRTLKQLLANGFEAKQILMGGCSHLEVAQALCWAVPDAPASAQGAVVTHVFTGPEIQQIRRDGKFECIESTRLRWDGVDDTHFRYSFKLRLYPNADREANQGAVALYWELTYAPEGEQRAWQMPYERCTVVLRVLCGHHAPDGVQHKTMTLDGRTSEGFGAHLARKVPENGSLIDATCWGWSSVLSAEGAYFGHFFLGPAKDTVVVQCVLCLV